jgi:hypothetical protein
MLKADSAGTPLVWIDRNPMIAVTVTSPKAGPSAVSPSAIADWVLTPEPPSARVSRYRITTWMQ